MTKQIDIKEVISKMNDGWVAMNKNGLWVWYLLKPKLDKYHNKWRKKRTHFNMFTPLFCFNIAPANDWTKSLIKIERK